MIYRIYQRVAETDEAYASEASPALVIAIPDKPKIIKAGYEEIKVKPVAGFEYCLDDMLRQDGNVFNNGRSKNMLLGASVQNIYPEEIEDKLNSMTLVMESIVVQRDQKLVALVHPDLDEAKNLGFTHEDLEGIMEQNRNGLNQMLPAYAKISEIEIYNEEFAKTPKKNIKRYLYK